MLYTNEKVLVHAEGDLDALEASVNQLEEFLEATHPGIRFEFQSEPFPHYLVPEDIDFGQLRNVLGEEIKRRAINENVLQLTDKTVTRQVKYYFTHSELEQKADQLVNSIKDRDELELRKKALMHQLNEELKEIDAGISKLAMQRRERSEMRQYECTKQLNFAERKVYYVQEGEIVDMDDMTAQDRQMFIQFGEAAPPPSEEALANQQAEVAAMGVDFDTLPGT